MMSCKYITIGEQQQIIRKKCSIVLTVIHVVVCTHVSIVKPIESNQDAN